MKPIVKIGKYLQLSLGKYLIQITLGNVEQLCKFPIALQAVYLVLAIHRTRRFRPGTASCQSGRHLTSPAHTADIFCPVLGSRSRLV